MRRTHSVWFHFVKEPRYFSGIDEIREQTVGDWRSSFEESGGWNTRGNESEAGNRQDSNRKDVAHPLGRLPGSVWSIPSEPLLIPDDTRILLDLPDHFAAFPQEWPRRIITGWSPTGICTVCGEGRRPVVEQHVPHDRHNKREAVALDGGGRHRAATLADGQSENTITDYACACPTPDAPTTPAVILDPFGGTGTVAGVAKTLGRYGISNDLSESYNRLAIWRITQSGHFTKTEQRSWADRQGSLL